MVFFVTKCTLPISNELKLEALHGQILQVRKKIYPDLIY